MRRSATGSMLTKPLGTGLLATAAKRGDARTRGCGRAVRDRCASSMRPASRAALAVGARCATDVTGFGLLGHASHIAHGQRRDARHRRRPRSAAARRARGVGAGHPDRRRRAERRLSRIARRVGRHASDAFRALLIDPQTSGGLLVAVPAGSRRRVSFARSRERRDRRGRSRGALGLVLA